MAFSGSGNWAKGYAKSLAQATHKKSNDSEGEKKDSLQSNNSEGKKKTSLVAVLGINRKKPPTPNKDYGSLSTNLDDTSNPYLRLGKK